jgi:Ribonuclease G/E
MASSSELVINSTQNGCRIALLRDKNLIEFHNEENANKFTVGDIYLGTVKKVVPGLNAAFIDIGYKKDDLNPPLSAYFAVQYRIQLWVCQRVWH